MQPYYGNMSIKIPYLRKKISPTLFALSTIALLLLASSPLLLSPFTIRIFAQTEPDAGDAAAATTTSGATNETTTAASPARNNMTGVQFLFIQTAQSGTLSQINATANTLELRNVSDKTILFSDRPDRIVISQNTSNFVGNWSQGEDSFAADPPNAALVLDDEEQRQELAVIELYNPEYDSGANTLKYDISAANATSASTTTTTTATTATSIGLPSEFGQSTLIIDADVINDGEIDRPDSTSVIDSDNQQGRYVPGQQPDVTGGVTESELQNQEQNAPPTIPPMR